MSRSALQPQDKGTQPLAASLTSWGPGLKVLQVWADDPEAKTDDLEAKAGVRRTGRGQHPRLWCPGEQLRPAVPVACGSRLLGRRAALGKAAEDPKGMADAAGPRPPLPPRQSGRVLFEPGAVSL